ncbi:MAG: RidA family protein [Saprospiraceae bacterium]
MEVSKFDSGTPWESTIKYSRAVRRGNFVAVSGTTAMDKDQLVGPGDAGKQALFVFEKIIHALEQVGAGIEDVVRTRMYITNPADAEAVTQAHAQVFTDVRPSTTLLVVAGFIDPALLVEIEADAFIL